MTNGFTAYVWLSYLLHFYGALQAGIYTCFLQSCLQCHTVDHCCQHTHIVALGALYAGLGLIHAAVYVTATYHYSYLYSYISYSFNFFRILIQHLRIYTKIAIAH